MSDGHGMPVGAGYGAVRDFESWSPDRPGNRYDLHLEDIDTRIERLALKLESLPSVTLAVLADYLTYWSHMKGKEIIAFTSVVDQIELARLRGEHSAYVKLARDVGSILEARRMRTEEQRQLQEAQEGDEGE